MRRNPILFACTLVAGAGLALPAQASFNVCNTDSQAARVALGHFDGTHWASEGWWTIAPGKCAGLLSGPLEARYYYLYATDGAAGTWDGSKGFCVSPSARFSIAGRGGCAARGYERRGFFEIDTGQSPDWTQSLSN